MFRDDMGYKFGKDIVINGFFLFYSVWFFIWEEIMIGDVLRVGS